MLLDNTKAPRRRGGRHSREIAATWADLPGIPSMLLFFKLLIGHAVSDFVLQSDTMARAKLRRSELSATHGPGFPPWYYWLSAHALVHGGAVYLLTGSALLGAVELTLHWVIDFAKCEHWINIHQDQALHVICKAAYCTLLYAAPNVL